MPSTSENITVQSRILKYAQDIGWILVSRSKAETRRSFSDGVLFNVDINKSRLLNIKGISKNSGALYDPLY